MNPLQIQAQKATSTFAKPWVRALSALGLAAGVWALSAGASTAHAADVYWSVGVQSPGVQLGVSNAWPAPAYVQRPRPVYVQPVPVVVYPAYRQVRPVVVYQDAAPQYVYSNAWAAPIGRGHGWRDRHDRGDRHERGHGHGHGYGHRR